MIESLKGDTQWISGCVFTGDHVRAANIEQIAACFVDVDHHLDGSKAQPSEAARRAVEPLAIRSGANLWHHTRNGMRLVYVLAEPRPAEDAGRLCKAAAQFARKRLEGAPDGYHVDTCSTQAAHVYYGPRGFEVRRGLNRRLWNPARLLEHAPDEPEPMTDREVEQIERDAFQRARDRWLEANAIEYPERPGTCLICGHNECFKAVEGVP